MQSLSFFRKHFPMQSRLNTCELAAGMLFATLSIAQTTEPPPDKVIPSSGGDFTGDKLILRTTVKEFTSLDKKGTENGSTTKLVAPKGTKLRVTRDLKVDDQSNNNLYVQVLEQPCPAIAKVVVDRANEDGLLGKMGFKKHPGCPAGDNIELVSEGEAYKVDRNVLQDHGYYRSGWTYGALLVPYKYHFHDKSFDSATTIGPYLGYHQGWIGIDATLVGSIGLATLPATKTENGTSSTTSLQGFSVAFGLITSVSKNNNPLQVGILFGKDWAGSNSAVPYDHEGEWWVAAQIGYAFTQ